MLLKPYSIIKPLAYETGKYVFKNYNGNEYEILFARKNDDYSRIIVSFNLIDSDDCYTLTGNGDVYKILSTIVTTVKKYVDENLSVKSFEFSGYRKPGEMRNCISQRTRVFQRYIPFIFSTSDWNVISEKNSVIISKKRKPNFCGAFLL